MTVPLTRIVTLPSAASLTTAVAPRRRRVATASSSTVLTQGINSLQSRSDAVGSLLEGCGAVGRELRLLPLRRPGRLGPGLLEGPLRLPEQLPCLLLRARRGLVDELLSLGELRGHT